MFKNQCILYEQFRTKNSGIKTGYMAYHDSDLFFVVYLAYVNMSLLDEKYLELIPEPMDQGILKNIFLTNIYQVPKNFPEKLKNIVEYLLRTENHVDISFETIPPLFRTDGSTVPAYHHVYTKNSGIKTGYMAYHDPDLFFVVYLAYINMSILDEKYLELIPELMDQGILKNIFLTSIYQVPKNFPEKLKNIVEYIFRTENHVDISFETIPPLFRTDESTVPAYHHVYIKHNKEPLITQQQPEWEMTRSNEFPVYYNRFRDFQIFDFRKTRNKNFYLIGETPTMSIWRTKPFEKILNPKICITSEEQDFINQLWADSP